MLDINNNIHIMIYTNNNIHIMIFSKVLIIIEVGYFAYRAKEAYCFTLTCRMQRSTSESNQLMYAYCKVAMANKDCDIVE